MQRQRFGPAAAAKWAFHRMDIAAGRVGRNSWGLGRDHPAAEEIRAGLAGDACFSGRGCNLGEFREFLGLLKGGGGFEWKCCDFVEY